MPHVLPKKIYVIESQWDCILPVKPVGQTGSIMYYHNRRGERAYALHRNDGRTEYGVWFQSKKNAEEQFHLGTIRRLRSRKGKIEQELVEIQKKLARLEG